MKNLAYFFIVLFHLYPVSANPAILPLPQKIELGRGAFKLNKEALTIQINVGDQIQYQLLLVQLQNSLAKKNIRLEPTQSNRPDIWIGNPELSPDLKTTLSRSNKWPDERIGTQGYVLHIEQDGILIAGNTDQGIFYGVQSLIQLFRAESGESVPAYSITDWPSMPYRAVMDDISRGPVPHMAFMKQQIRRYSELKINMMSFYIEHIIQTKAHGGFAPAGGAISLEEWKELSDYAKDYHVELIGSFQSLGHFEKILSFPQYAPLGETNRMLSPTNEAAGKFLTEVIGEMLPSFSSSFFNINGDEAWDLSRGSLQALADSIGVARIYADHMNPVIDFLHQNGKKVMMWGDIIMQNPELLTLIPPEVVILTWNYSPSDSFETFIDPFQQSGFDFFVCPGVLNSNRLIPDFRMSLTNIRNFVNEGYQKGAKGMFLTVWDDGGLHAFSRDWYGIAFGAEQAWQPNHRPQHEFDVRFSHGIYGDDDMHIVSALHTINELTDLSVTQGMNNSIFFNRVVPDRHGNLTIDMSDWTAVEHISQQAKMHIDHALTRSYADDLPFITFAIEQYLFMSQSRKNILTAANSYHRACLLQTSDPILTRDLLLNALQNMIGSYTELNALKNQLKILWLRENRMYWYDEAMRSYQSLLDDYHDAIYLIEGAIADFDKGFYLPPPSAVRLSVSEKAGSYFQYWLMTGPFHIDHEHGSKPDFLQPIGGESAARPIPGLRFTAGDGQVYMWDRYDFPLDAGIDLLAVFEKNTEAVAYAYATIESATDQQVLATFGSNDGIAVFLNGEKLYEIYEKRSLIPDENETYLPLKSGVNHLLLKIDQWKGGWGFSFRLPDEDVRNHKHRYRIIQKP